MSKRHKHQASDRPAGPPKDTDPAAWRSHVEALIARGKTREAVDSAKDFYKQTRSLDAEGLVADAYAARIRALLAQGLAREARELASIVAERYPGLRSRVMPLVQETAARADHDVGPLLAALASADEATRRDLEATLGRVVTDPRAVADHPALAEDDPLRHAARVVSDLFSAVTTGPLPQGALAHLDAIPRQSPMAPWKLLVRAIDAYYRRADASVRANLSAIPMDSAVGRLVPVLGCLAGEGNPVERRTLAERVVLDKVSGGRVRFAARLAEVAGALRARDGRRAAMAIRDLGEAAESAPPGFRATFVATVLAQWMRLDLNPGPLMAALTRGRNDVETLRHLALALERVVGWPAALPAWDAYLDVAQRTGALPRAGRAPSLVLLRMAALLPSDVEELLDFAMAEDEAELARLIRDGVIPRCFDRGGLLDRARAADPHADVFRALVAHREVSNARHAETEAEAWRRAHPRDLEPLLYLAAAAERRGAHQKALGLLEQAEAIDRVHPDVRRRRLRVLLGSAERRLRDGKVDLARADIDRLALEPAAAEGDRPAYLQSLRWAAAHRGGDAASAAAIETALATQLGNPVLLELLLEAVAVHLSMGAPGAARPRLPETSIRVPRLQAIEGLARAADLLFGLDRPFGMPEELVQRIELNPRGAPAGHLHSLCTVGLRLRRLSLVYAASGAGLEEDGGLVYRFLLARGQALAHARLAREHARARQCLRAAHTLAARVRDADALREASAALRVLRVSTAFLDDDESDDEPGDHDDLTVDEIRRVIEGERQRTAAPVFDSAPAPPVRRRRPKRARSRLRPPAGMQDFLDFLESQP